MFRPSIGFVSLLAIAALAAPGGVEAQTAPNKNAVPAAAARPAPAAVARPAAPAIARPAPVARPVAPAIARPAIARPAPSIARQAPVAPRPATRSVARPTVTPRHAPQIAAPSRQPRSVQHAQQQNLRQSVQRQQNAQRHNVQRKVFPGYVLARMEMDDETWYALRNTPGVTGFVNVNNKPVPLAEQQVH